MNFTDGLVVTTRAKDWTTMWRCRMTDKWEDLGAQAPPPLPGSGSKRDFTGLQNDAQRENDKELEAWVEDLRSAVSCATIATLIIII